MKKVAPIFISRDLEISARYYEALGGKTRLYKEGGYLFLTLEGVEFHIREYSWPSDQLNKCGAYLFVEDADALYEKLKGTDSPGILNIEDREWGMREFSIDDPDHNLIRIGSPLTQDSD